MGALGMRGSFLCAVVAALGASMLLLGPLQPLRYQLIYAARGGALHAERVAADVGDYLGGANAAAVRERVSEYFVGGDAAHRAVSVARADEAARGGAEREEDGASPAEAAAPAEEQGASPADAAAPAEAKGTSPAEAAPAQEAAPHASPATTGPVASGSDGGALTSELVRSVAKDNLVMVTWANFHYLDFVMNWVGHLRELGVSNYIVGAMDDKMLDALRERDVPTFAMDLNSLTLGDFGWGSPTFHKMGRQKIALISKFTELGVDILLTDVDVVYARDPNEYVQRKELRAADVLTSSDHLGSTLDDGDDGLEHWPQAGSAFNIGIMLFRATDASRAFARTWQEAIDADPKYWDQAAFNDLIRKGGTKPLAADGVSSDRLFVGWGGRMTAGILPVALFCSGHTGFVQRMYAAKGFDRPYAIHATYQYAGTEGKRHRMREAMAWLDEPAYYDPPGGVVAADFEIPAELLGAKMYDGTMEGLRGHFDLVHYSLRRLRAMYAVGVALGRAVVLPRVMCGADRVWFPHRGVFPGSQGKLPFACPADHFLEVDKMHKALNGDLIRAAPGAVPVPFREHSFLQNPRRPGGLSEARVRVCAPDEGDGCAAPEGGVSVAAGLSDAALVEALDPVRDAKVIVLEGAVESAFGTFESADVQRKYEDALRVYPSMWGQVSRDAGPGHVWYDFFADVVPWTDKVRATSACAGRAGARVRGACVRAQGRPARTCIATPRSALTRALSSLLLSFRAVPPHAHRPVAARAGGEALPCPGGVLSARLGARRRARVGSAPRAARAVAAASPCCRCHAFLCPTRGGLTGARFGERPPTRGALRARVRPPLSTRACARACVRYVSSRFVHKGARVSRALPRARRGLSTCPCLARRPPRTS